MGMSRMATETKNHNLSLKHTRAPYWAECS
jgi:hypothetical protein